MRSSLIPSLSSNDSMNIVIPNPESFSQIAHGCPIRMFSPNCINLLPCELSLRMVFANTPRYYQPSLSNHIKSIVPVGAQKQMVRAHTGRIVAVMADEHSRWNRAIVENPRESMSLRQFAIYIQARVLILLSGKNPTAIRLCDLIPKSFLHRQWRTRGAGSTAKYVIPVCVENTAAAWTLFLNHRNSLFLWFRRRWLQPSPSFLCEPI